MKVLNTELLFNIKKRATTYHSSFELPEIMDDSSLEKEEQSK